jgi:hypothetical protein
MRNIVRRQIFRLESQQAQAINRADLRGAISIPTAPNMNPVDSFVLSFVADNCPVEAACRFRQTRVQHLR